MAEDKSKSVKSVRGIVDELFPVYQIQTKESNFVKTGFIGIDKLCGGFRKGNLHTIAVRPGMGKTAFLLSLITNISVIHSKKLAVFSLERKAESLIKRLVEGETGFSYNAIQDETIPQDTLQHTKALINTISNAQIFIDDARLLSIQEFKEKTSSLIKEFDIDIVFIDYLQLMHSTYEQGQDKEKMKEDIAKALKELAKEMDIPIVIFSQINKVLNLPGDEKSILLKDLNKGVAEHSDSVFIIFRSDYFQLDFDLSIAGGEHKALAEIIIAKHPGFQKKERVTVQFLESIDRFVDLK